MKWNGITYPAGLLYWTETRGFPSVITAPVHLPSVQKSFPKLPNGDSSSLIGPAHLHHSRYFKMLPSNNPISAYLLYAS